MIDRITNKESTIVTSNRILYTPSSFARSSLLHLQEIGELDAQKQHKSSRENLQSYLFFIVLNGAGNIVYRGKKYSLTTGDCVFIDCLKPYSHITDSDNLWTLRWVHFNGPTMTSIYDKYKERGGRPVFRLAENKFNEIWNNLFHIASSSDYLRDMLINQHLSELMTLLMSESWHPEDRVTAKKKASVNEVKDYIDNNYVEKITLDGLASQFFINKYYLTKVFKEQYGMSLSSYILSVRITKAKQMLRFSEKSIEEIGYECGLGSPHYFSQTFKSIEGVPPSVYRKQW